MNLRLLFSFILGYGLGCLYLPQQAWGQCDRVSDSLELVKLYNATDGPNWKNKWDLGKPMNQWFGITLSSTGCVSKIYLYGNQLKGSIPNLNLPTLKHLEFVSNQLTGNIPNFNLPNLENLILFNDQLEGSIPDFNLPSLKSLDLSLNQLSGNIPDFNLPNLQKLVLYKNKLTGSMPNFNLPNLISLELYNNQLSGNIPNFSLPKLINLYLSFNELSGSIPDFNLPNLESLFLNSNELSGSIPDFDLPKLATLVLTFNQLSGSIPNFNLPNLTRLSINFNQMSGSIPNFNLPKLTILDLYGNKLSGSIPNFNLPNLTWLNLASNQLSGSIPNFTLPSLTGFRLDINRLTGSIPNFNFSNLPKLETMNLSSNQLSGNIPNFNLPNLGGIWLASNQLSGSIPDFNLPELRHLDLSSNQLSGSIPDFKLTRLGHLDLSSNRFSGSIPNFNFPDLQFLFLYSNQLTGSIPNFNLPALNSFLVYKNKLTFEDLTIYSSFIAQAKIVYDPQDSIYRDTTIRGQIGQPLTIDLGIDVSIADNLYTWTKNGQAFRSITGNNKLAISSLQATDAGTYRVRVTNPRALALTLYSKAIRIVVNNCTSIANARLNSSAPNDNICTGTSISLSATGGTTYRWSTGQTTSSINLSVTQNQTVTVSITDAIGCSQTLSRNLVAMALPKAEITSPGTNICAGGKLTLTASPVSGAQYEWLHNNNSVLGRGLANTYEATMIGSYTVQVTAAGCTNTSAPLVLQQGSGNPAIKLNLSPTRDTLCPGDSVRIIASGGLKYTWSTGSSSSAIAVKPAQSSTYAVTIVDASNCNSILRQTISMVPAPQAKISLSELNCGHTLLATATGGKAPYRYRWSNSSTTSSVTLTQKGNYELLLVDARQCSTKANIVVDSFSFLTVAPILLNPNCGSKDGSISLQLDPSREPYQIEWTPSGEGQGDNPRIELDAGTYQALIMDKLGCMDTLVVTLIKQEDCDKDFLIYRSLSPNGDGVNEYFVIKAKITGGCPSGLLNVCYPNNELTIFNRWQEKVYQKQGYNSEWDADGFPGGAYFFLFYPDKDKPKGAIKGALTVLK